jgi:hypothetical protein
MTMNAVVSRPVQPRIIPEPSLVPRVIEPPSANVQVEPAVQVKAIRPATQATIARPVAALVAAVDPGIEPTWAASAVQPIAPDGFNVGPTLMPSGGYGEVERQAARGSRASSHAPTTPQTPLPADEPWRWGAQTVRPLGPSLVTPGYGPIAYRAPAPGAPAAAPYEPDYGPYPYDDYAADPETGGIADKLSPETVDKIMWVVVLGGIAAGALIWWKARE